MHSLTSYELEFPTDRAGFQKWIFLGILLKALLELSICRLIQIQFPYNWLPHFLSHIMQYFSMNAINVNALANERCGCVELGNL